MKWKLGIGIVILIGVLLLAGCSNGETGPTGQIDQSSSSLSGVEVTVFKSMACGCCGIYSQYLDKEGIDTTVENVPDMIELKAELGVPEDMQSCHTTQVEGYFVEGHVPIEAIEKLLEERPDVAGIALPGMPSGSPGMPGKKTEPWVIFAIGNDGSSYEFMTL